MTAKKSRSESFIYIKSIQSMVIGNNATEYDASLSSLLFLARIYLLEVLCFINHYTISARTRLS